MRVLIVEDEKKIASFIRNGLQEERFIVDVLNSGNEALPQIMSGGYDAVVLDIMLPGRDGLSVLRAVRSAGSNVPVMLLSARCAVSERIEGLNLGADDYLPKPFSIDELIARLNAVMRRATGDKMTILRVGDLSMNLVTREVKRVDAKVELTAREFALLEYLMRSPGRVLSRSNISEHVWDHHFDSGTNIVDVYIQRLRSKIDYEHPVKLLHTIRGVGYAIRSDP